MLIKNKITQPKMFFQYIKAKRIALLQYDLSCEELLFKKKL